MKNALLLTLVIILLNSCSKIDDFYEYDCKILGTNGIYEWEYDETQNILVNTGNITYAVQYMYNENNQLIERIHTNINSSEFEYDRFKRGIRRIGNDKIEYDYYGRVSKISSEYLNKANILYIEIFEYNNVETNPTKITYYRHDIEDNLTSVSNIRNLTYNNKRQLTKVFGENINFVQIKTYETTFEYNKDGNLTEINYNAFDENKNIKSRKIETFENYDTYRNPFNGLPFTDLIGVSESNNNFTKYSREYYNYTTNTLGETSETLVEAYSYSSTDIGYLDLSKYQCEE